MGRRPRWYVLACVLVVVTGCTAPEPTASPRATAATARTRSPSAAAPPPASDPADDRGTPLAISVASDGPPGSLAGLHEAATVVEYRLTVRTTALVVISRGGAAAVGPLRPATAHDAAVAAAFDADLVATTASPTIVEQLGSRGRRVVEESAPAGAVLRDPARRAPYNAYALPARARRRSTAHAGGSTAVWLRGPVPSAQGRPAAEVRVAVAPQVQVAWIWNPTTARWLRTAGRQAARTADGAPVTAATVVVLEVADARGGPSSLSGVGPAAVLHRGRRHAARWARDVRRAAVSLQTRDGAAFPVEGRVWTIVCASPCAQQIAPSAPRPADGAR